MLADDIVERVRKLLRLAANTAASETEAAALECANALLIRHNLTMECSREAGKRGHGGKAHDRGALTQTYAGVCPAAGAGSSAESHRQHEDTGMGAHRSGVLAPPPHGAGMLLSQGRGCLGRQ